MASLVNSNAFVEKIEALITKLLQNGIDLNASQIRTAYLDNIKWHSEHFEHIEEWFGQREVTISPTNLPTDPPTNPPTNPPTDAPGDANSLVLSFGLFIACLMSLRILDIFD